MQEKGRIQPWAVDTTEIHSHLSRCCWDSFDGHIFPDEAFQEEKGLTELWGSPGVVIGVFTNVLNLICQQWIEDSNEDLAL